MACTFPDLFLEWRIALECCAVTTQCHCLLPGVNIVEVCRYGTTNNKAHVDFPAQQHLVACATSARSFAKKKMVSGGLTILASLIVNRGWDHFTISLLQRVSSGTFVRCHCRRRMKGRTALHKTIVVKHAKQAEKANQIGWLPDDASTEGR
jgi:hypothetical protein